MVDDVEVAWTGILIVPNGSPPTGEPSHFNKRKRRLHKLNMKMNDKARRMDNGWSMKGDGGGRENNKTK